MLLESAPAAETLLSYQVLQRRLGSTAVLTGLLSCQVLQQCLGSTAVLTGLLLHQVLQQSLGTAAEVRGQTLHPVLRQCLGTAAVLRGKVLPQVLQQRLGTTALFTGLLSCQVLQQCLGTTALLRALLPLTVIEVLAALPEALEWAVQTLCKDQQCHRPKPQMHSKQMLGRMWPAGLHEPSPSLGWAEGVSRPRAKGQHRRQAACFKQLLLCCNACIHADASFSRYPFHMEHIKAYTDWRNLRPYITCKPTLDMSHPVFHVLF